MPSLRTCLFASVSSHLLACKQSLISRGDCGVRVTRVLCVAFSPCPLVSLAESRSRWSGYVVLCDDGEHPEEPPSLVGRPCGQEDYSVYSFL